MTGGIVFVIRNGLRWRDAPRDYGPHKTIYNRFVRWSRLGVFNKIFGTFDFHIGLVQSPAGTNRALAGAKLLIQQRGVFRDPTIERGMVNLDAALFHHFLDLPIAYWICHVPADAPEDDLTFKMAALELDHRAIPPDPFPAIIPPGLRQEQFATEPPCLYFLQIVQV